MRAAAARACTRLAKSHGASSSRRPIAADLVQEKLIVKILTIDFVNE
jgi:hypothetical protein